MDKITQNYLLNKQITIFQPEDGYRASTDAVLLSATVSKVKKGDTILDVGSGTGAISLCLAARFKDNKITGLELQKGLAELSNLSARENGFENLNYINCDIKNFKTEEQFSHVITNPPYSEKDMPSPNESKRTAHNHQDFSLKDWMTFCIKRIKPQGFFYIINRAENITEMLAIMFGKLGNIKIIPIHSKDNEDAKRVIIIAQKDSKAPAKILKPLILHNPDGSYTHDAEKILRNGNILP